MVGKWLSRRRGNAKGARHIRRAPFVITPSVPQPYPAISQSQFIHSSELLYNHLPTIHQPRSNPDSTILRVESKSDFTQPSLIRDSSNRQCRAAWPWLVHQLPRPSRHFLHHPRREGNCEVAGNAAISAAGGEKRKTLEKWAFRGVCPSSFLKCSLKFPKCFCQIFSFLFKDRGVDFSFVFVYTCGRQTSKGKIMSIHNFAKCRGG